MPSRVIIVDDNRDNLYLLECLLKPVDFEVVPAKNGEDALEKARLFPPDLIVSDILMPVMDGYALCRAWQSDDTLKRIPFVFYTATYTDPQDEAFALSLGAERFIIKPQNPEIVVSILIDLMKEKKALKSAVTKPLGEDMEFFKQHNEILSRKLEKKMSDLETANQKLRILTEQYQLSFENVMEVIYNIDTDFNIISISPSVEKMLGYKPQDFIGRPVSDLRQIMTPNSLAQATADAGLVLKGKTITAAIYEFIAKNGTIKFGEVSGSPVIRDGKVVGIVSVARDITERRQLEEALRYSESRLNSIITTSQDWVWEIDSGGRHTFSNPAVRNILGYDPDEIVGHSLHHFIHPEDLPKVVETLSRSIAQKAGWPSLIMRWKHRDGRYRFLESNAVPLLDSAGSVIGFQGSDRDITERRRAEEEREKLISELQQALSKIKTLSGLLPICASCKKIRDDKGYWNHLELYIEAHSGAEFTHGICPECSKRLYPMLNKEK